MEILAAELQNYEDKTNKVTKRLANLGIKKVEINVIEHKTEPTLQ